MAPMIADNSWTWQHVGVAKYIIAKKEAQDGIF